VWWLIEGTGMTGRDVPEAGTGSTDEPRNEPADANERASEEADRPPVRPGSDDESLGPAGWDAGMAAGLSRATDAEKGRILRAHFQVAATEDAYGWIAELEAARAAYTLRTPTIRSICADVSWALRTAGAPYPSELRATRGQSEKLTAPGLAEVYAEGYRLRYDYRFELLGRRCVDWMQDYPDDSLVRAFAAVSALGLRAPQGMELYRAALDAPDADTRTRHTCLAGIWLAYDQPNQAQEILVLANTLMAKGEANPNVFYRRAAALRKLGRFEEAVDSIDRAMGLLDTRDNLIHQDFVRERELIVSAMEVRSYVESLTDDVRTRLFADVEERVDAATAELEERVDQAQTVVSEGLLKIVEILGLFVALIGFVAGTGATALSAQTVSERIVSMGMVLAGSLAFFILLRLVTSFRRRP
jgi:tetratricopeptide (TPR) repeat protein